MKNKIGIIGFGNMGKAIGEQLKAKYSIWALDKDKTKTQDLCGIKVADNIIDLLNNVDTVILAVKPQDFETLLTEIKDYVKDKLIISIAAGLTTAYLEKALGNVRVIRAMPNIAAKIGAGITGLCKGKFATDSDLNFAKKVFAHLGATLIVKEEMMNAVTAISGSGPGYFYDLLEAQKIDDQISLDKISKEFKQALTKAAYAISFDVEQAEILAEAIIKGSIALLKATGLTPAELKKQITSKGGTTEAGLNVLHRGGSLIEAVKAAKKRAEELSIN
jgi:pyrroline-5-carboxylate reductase